MPPADCRPTRARPGSLSGDEPHDGRVQNTEVAVLATPDHGRDLLATRELGQRSGQAA